MSAESDEFEHVDTQDLIDALRRRSRVFYLAMRPLADDPECNLICSVGVDGKPAMETADERDRVFGLVHQTNWELMRAVYHAQEN